MRRRRVRIFRKGLVAMGMILVLAGSIGAGDAEKENVRKRDMQYREISYEDELAEAKNSIDLGDVSAVTKDLILPQSYGIHVQIDWESSDEGVVSKEGRVAIPEEKEGDKKVTLTAVLSSTMMDATETVTVEVTVKALPEEEYLDVEAAKVQNYVDYLLNDGELLPGQEDIGLASKLSWSVASGNAKIEKGMLKKTEAAAEREPIVLEAELKKGSSKKTVTFWAPECNYNPVTEEYIIYWSDPDAEDNNGNTYYNTTKDFLTFSEPGILYDRDITMIDASIKKYKGRYYMVYNDAYGDNETGKGGKIIYMAASDSLEPGSFRQISGAISPAGIISEGPFLMEDFRTGEWYAMYDHYGLHKYGVSKTEDLESDAWEYLGVSETMPTDNIRHGGALPVTEKELEQVINTWGSEEQKASWKTELLKVQEDAKEKAAEREASDKGEKTQEQDKKAEGNSFARILKNPIVWIILVLAAGVLAGAAVVFRKHRK